MASTPQQESESEQDQANNEEENMYSDELEQIS